MQAPEHRLRHLMVPKHCTDVVKRNAGANVEKHRGPGATRHDEFPIMNIWFAIGSAALIAAGGGCLYFRRRSQAEIELMAATQTSRAADVARMAPGTLVEVKGLIRCATPLKAQFSERACVYSRSIVEREQITERNGKREREYRTESDVENYVVFQIEDASGRVSVVSAGASVEAPEVFDRTGNQSLSGGLIDLAANLAGLGQTHYRYRESILAPDTQAYVLGTRQADGSIGAALPGATRREFIITHKSEEQRVASTRAMTTILLALAVASFLGAIALLYVAFKYTAS